jgi:hypothetical protein
MSGSGRFASGRAKAVTVEGGTSWLVWSAAMISGFDTGNAHTYGLTFAVMDNPATRAAHYREQAAELRLWALREIDGSSIQDQLLDLAAQYDKLAKETENSPYP